jgi:hypothetical protein
MGSVRGLPRDGELSAMTNAFKRGTQFANIVAAMPQVHAAARQMIDDAQERETLIVECAALGIIVDTKLPLIVLRAKRDAAMRGEL